MKTAAKIAWRFLTHAKGQSILIAVGIAAGVSVQVFIGSLISGLQIELVDTAIGRNTQGVRLIQLEDGDHLVSVARLAEREDDDESLGDPTGGGPGASKEDP